MRSSKNGWKFAFFLLAAVVFILIIVLFIMVRTFFPEAEESHYTPNLPANEEGLLTISSTREQMNQLIAEASSQLEEETPYTVELLSDFVEFRSTFSILGQSVPISVEFEPEVANSGDLLLTAESFSFGIFNIPSDQAMQLLKNNTELPDWIVIHPSESMIEVQVTNAQFDDRYSFRVQAFDLANDEIEVEMFVNE
ncbi:YpmS family protein [Alkalicoccobacillus plakortidis]|uniref:YpmS family protein n=1 Tax=Alkalicoccobacillus plakortidis TaxID=444060 RepID=A0ABT0XLT1_9BACI|nr:YpmS family protein [Alkalicoccobacillus plakortidis]MCM2676675.1 YpmS family protein [Alkalicoccobacillus plakortidis]